METEEIYVHQKVLDEYLFRASKQNRIRKFYSDIFRSMPKELYLEAKTKFVDLEHSVVAEEGYKGVKAYRFIPRDASSDLKVYFKKFTVFVEVVTEEWLAKKQEFAEKVADLHCNIM